MFGLGKTRSKFGKWVDKKNIKQNDIAKASEVGRTTISNMCSDPNHKPRYETWVKVEKVLKTWGHNVKREDFFDM
jgi:predicted XRE-type DNA-binding protein